MLIDDKFCFNPVRTIILFRPPAAPSRRFTQALNSPPEVSGGKFAGEYILKYDLIIRSLKTLHPFKT